MPSLKSKKSSSSTNKENYIPNKKSKKDNSGYDGSLTVGNKNQKGKSAAFRGQEPLFSTGKTSQMSRRKSPKHNFKQDGQIDAIKDTDDTPRDPTYKDPAKENGKLKKQLNIAQGKISDLLNLLEQGREQFKIYIPKKSDRIDSAMAEFINKYPERDSMKIMFLRESEGVYRFGTRQVQIKIEQGNKIFCRVGGGYLSVSEFLELYQDDESEKVHRSDVMQRF